MSLTTRGPTETLGDILARQRNAVDRIAVVVRVSLFFPPFWMLSRFSNWTNWPRTTTEALLWPAQWLGAPPSVSEAGVLASVLALAAMVGALAASWRFARVIGFLALLEWLALDFSFGKIHHFMHGWLFLSFIWIFAPSNWARPDRLSRPRRAAVLYLFSAVQLAVAATYTLSGIGKLLGAVYQVCIGEVSAFHPEAFARHVAERIQQTGEPSALGRLVIDAGAFGAPVLWINTYLQLCAVLFARQARHQAWYGSYLCLFHVASSLILTIEFSPAIVLVGALFVSNPLSAEPPSVRRVCTELPGFGRLLKRLVPDDGP